MSNEWIEAISDMPKIKCDRLEAIISTFLVKFGTQPELVCCVPGRVNLIGEHIDYCGYSVLPMALEQTIDVAFRSVPGSSELFLSNLDDKYESCQVSMNSICIDKSKVHWSNYFLCGVLGVIEEARGEKISISSGIQALVSGKVPPSAGLSSSSALVCSGAIIANHIFQVGLTKSELASLCARSEKFVGTEGGGMDQAIAIMAEKGFAKLIDFNPLRTTDVLLPMNAVFVVFNSLVEANKAAFESFNHRVVEGRIGVMLMAKKLCLTGQEYRRASDLQKGLEKTLPEMATLVKEHLHDEAYTKNEVCELLELTVESFENNVLTTNTKQIDSFKAKQRLLHVFSEAARVHEFKKICDCPNDHALSRLGQLMNESHSSCRDLYECSHPQLDRLVDIVSSLAYGARLTGAGWGGCAVALVPATEVESLLTKVRSEFYGSINRNVDVNTAMFVTSPGEGASLHFVENIAQLK